MTNNEKIAFINQIISKLPEQQREREEGDDYTSGYDLDDVNRSYDDGFDSCLNEVIGLLNSLIK